MTTFIHFRGILTDETDISKTFKTAPYVVVKRGDWVRARDNLTSRSGHDTMAPAYSIDTEGVHAVAVSNGDGTRAFCERLRRKNIPYILTSVTHPEGRSIECIKTALGLN